MICVNITCSEVITCYTVYNNADHKMLVVLDQNTVLNL